MVNYLTQIGLDFFVLKALLKSMANRRQQEQIAGDAHRADDAYVWFAIRYLDSPTAYREYLPASGRASTMLLALGLILLAVSAGLALLSGCRLLG